MAEKSLEKTIDVDFSTTTSQKSYFENLISQINPPPNAIETFLWDFLYKHPLSEEVNATHLCEWFLQKRINDEDAIDFLTRSQIFSTHARSTIFSIYKGYLKADSSALLFHPSFIENLNDDKNPKITTE